MGLFEDIGNDIIERDIYNCQHWYVLAWRKATAWYVRINHKGRK